MQPRYLLYIDILGFKSLVEKQPHRISELYEIIDSLRVHGHDNFKTIVFSDTILVYSKDDVLDNDEAHRYMVMYSCEFAQDLMYRFVGKDFSFRGVLVYGEFDHYHLKHTECFFGKGLVNAYLTEKEIKCTGLFIDDASQKHNNIFPVVRHDSNLSYVFLNQSTERLWPYSPDGQSFPLTSDAGEMLSQTCDQQRLAAEVMWFKEIFTLANSHPSPEVRMKYLTAWNYQMQRYPQLLTALSQSGFNPRSITDRIDWKKTEFGRQLIG